MYEQTFMYTHTALYEYKENVSEPSRKEKTIQWIFIRSVLTCVGVALEHEQSDKVVNTPNDITFHLGMSERIENKKQKYI